VTRTGGAQIIPRPLAWRYGSAPPWSGHPPASLETAVIAARIAARGPGGSPAVAMEGTRPSAVLVALFDGPEGAEVLLTRRAWHLSSHKGEVSFPGGRLEPGETALHAALREAQEEVLLDPRGVDVVGELDHLATVASKSHIVPIVGTLPGRPVVAAGTSEVDRILMVPLVELLSPDTYREERWGAPPLDRSVHFFVLDDETIWGATARILVQLLAIAVGVDDVRDGA
jgi:8-oxo-dGTP pyrophosphatase MutT (NUDIX family)